MKPLDTDHARQRIGRKIAKIRADKGISQRRLAEKCDMNFSNIYRLEHGKLNITIDTLARIANALSCHVEIRRGKEMLQDIDTDE